MIRMKFGDVIVPPLHDRERLVADVAEAVGYSSADRVYALMKSRYHWRGMRAACVRFSEGCRANQVERAKFLPPPYLFPSFKGVMPFKTWAVDCITGLDPPAPNGGTTVIMAIDAWSKWLEYRVINPLDSREAALFLYQDIVCRFGVPAFVRCDRGVEFDGDFTMLCKQLHIKLVRISTMNPRANGLIERYNREVKAGMRRIITMCPRAQWYDVLPDVVRGLRVLPTTTTGFSPF